MFVANMRLVPATYATAILCGVLSIVVASPIRNFLNHFRRISSPPIFEDFDRRDSINCTDLGADFFEECWTLLGLTDYLQDPVTGWNVTTPVCSNTEDGTDQDGSNCCKEGVPWSTCYLHLAHGFAGDDCSTINTGSCSYDATMAVDPSIAPKVRYVMRNIYVVNQFFSTYYAALQYATSQAQLAISAIVNELDPTDPSTGIPWFDILSALSFGLAFLGAPTVAVGILDSTLTQEVKYVAQAFVISMQQSPSFAKALFPQGTDNSKSVQIGELSTDLGSTVQQLSQTINRAVTLLMTDMPTFVSFVQSGKYSGQTSFSIPNETVGLDIALKTYLASMGMWGNDWWASVLVGPYEQSDITGMYNCSFDSNNVCVDSQDLAVYLSPDTGRAFPLLHTKGYSDKTSWNLTQDLVNNQWAPLNVLFDGAFNCTAKGKAGTTDIQFTFNGTLDVSCISQLPIYIGCTGDCPVPFINGSCPFGDLSQSPNGSCD